MNLTTDATTAEFLDVRQLDGFLIFFAVFKGLLLVAGCIGNPLIIAAVVYQRRILDHGNVYVLSLAAADLLVTSLVDGFTMVGIVHYTSFYGSRTILCQLIGTVCIIACIASLWSMTGIALNRYFYVCHNNNVYPKLYTKRKLIISIVFIWVGSILLDLPLNLGWSVHGFDLKAMVCTWSRTESYSYALFFVCGAIGGPILVVAFCYTSIYLFVRKNKLRLENTLRQGASGGADADNFKVKRREIQMMKTFFAIFVMFFVCWGFYGILVLVDFEDNFSREIHALGLALAHANSSINSCIYGLLNKKFRTSYKKIFYRLFCFKSTQIGTTITVATDVTVDRRYNTNISTVMTSHNYERKPSGVETQFESPARPRYGKQLHI